jgi:hypothetical protein
VFIVPSASATCAVINRAGENKATLGCWRLPGATPIPIPTELAGLVVTRAATNSPLVIAERWGFHWWNLLPIISEQLDISVIDLSSGNRITLIDSRAQHDNKSPNIRNGYFQYALSPRGDLLTEAGDGEVRLAQLKRAFR